VRLAVEWWQPASAVLAFAGGIIVAVLGYPKLRAEASKMRAEGDQIKVETVQGWVREYTVTLREELSIAKRELAEAKIKHYEAIVELSKAQAELAAMEERHRGEQHDLREQLVIQKATADRLGGHVKKLQREVIDLRAQLDVPERRGHQHRGPPQ
jgi:hypothetical protein